MFSNSVDALLAHPSDQNAARVVRAIVQRMYERIWAAPVHSQEEREAYLACWAASDVHDLFFAHIRESNGERATHASSAAFMHEYSDGGRTRIGNTPTCEVCDRPDDSCTC